MYILGTQFRVICDNPCYIYLRILYILYYIYLLLTIYFLKYCIFVFRNIVNEMRKFNLLVNRVTAIE